MLRTMLFGLLASASALALSTRAAHGVEVGAPAPEIGPLQDLAGTSYSLSDYRGKVVLLGLVGYD